jgi:hypothetical protein
VTEGERSEAGLCAELPLCRANLVQGFGVVRDAPLLAFASPIYVLLGSSIEVFPPRRPEKGYEYDD